MVNNPLFVKFKTLGMKHLLVKVVVFLIPWFISLYYIDKYFPELIDWTKLVTSTYANTLAFLVAYVLTMIGFRYTNNKEDK